MRAEIWKRIKGFEDYEVSNLGRVRHGDHILSPGKRPDGYQLVGLYANTKRTNKLVHRLVAEAFLANPEGFPVVNHKDENPANNAVWNLEWCTSSYNANYGTRNRRISKAMTGRVVAESTREKLREVAEARSLAGESNPFYGKRHSEETRRRWSEIRKGRVWWTDGNRNIQSRECPGPEYTRGRTRKTD